MVNSVSALERCWPLILCSSVHLGLSDRVSVPPLNGSYSPHPFLQGPTLSSTATAKSHCLQSTYCAQAPFLAFTHRKHCEMGAFIIPHLTDGDRGTKFRLFTLTLKAGHSWLLHSSLLLTAPARPHSRWAVGAPQSLSHNPQFPICPLLLILRRFPSPSSQVFALGKQGQLLKVECG